MHFARRAAQCSTCAVNYLWLCSDWGAAAAHATANSCRVGERASVKCSPVCILRVTREAHWLLCWGRGLHWRLARVALHLRLVEAQRVFLMSCKQTYTYFVHVRIKYKVHVVRNETCESAVQSNLNCLHCRVGGKRSRHSQTIRHAHTNRRLLNEYMKYPNRGKTQP